MSDSLAKIRPDKPNWAAILQRHRRWLRTVVSARLRDPHTVDDVMQEVAVVVLRQNEPLKDMNRVGPWLYRVAMRQILQYRRALGRQRNRQQRVAQRLGDSSAASSDDPLSAIIAVETQQQLRDSLDALSGQDRELLMLRHGEGWTYRQLAEHLGIPLDKVIYRTGRAKRRLHAVWRSLEMSEQTS